jgi:DNA-binding response OmpR family regulator
MPNILVIDDNPGVLNVVESILKKEGHTVTSASGGREALEQLKTIQPDLILLDIMMPYLDGWDTLKLIREKESLKEVPVSMLTAKPLTPEIIGGENVKELVDYIQKPFSKESLLKRVNRIIEEAIKTRESAKDFPTIEDAKKYKKVLRLKKLHQNMLDTLKKNLTKKNSPSDEKILEEAIEYQESTLKSLDELKKEIEEKKK